MRQNHHANQPFDPGKWPVYYGWIILLWGTLGVLMSIPGQTIGFSAFTESLLDALPLNRDQLSLAYMAGTIGSALMLPSVGRIYDRMGVRRVAVSAAIGLGAVLVFLSQIDRVLVWIAGSPGILFTFTCTFIAFLCLRFCGQGVLTMVSKNMMMKWFEKRRGFATGFSNVIIALSFSYSPVILDHLIQQYSWRGAWLILAAVVGIAFALIAVIFYRNAPQESGLQPDGRYEMSARKKKYYFEVVRDFTLKETLRSYPFWIFALMLAMQGLYITGFTFHVVSIFHEADMSKTQALQIFQPSAYIAVVITLLASSLSDYIPLKYLALVKGTGACLGILGVIYLEEMVWAYVAVIIGNGIMMGLFSVITSVTWPRYFGLSHLGAINGQATMFIVFGSALGPILFSQSLTLFQSYQTAGWICFCLFFALTVGAWWANNPQLRISTSASEEHHRP